MTMMFAFFVSSAWPVWAPFIAAAGGVIVIAGLCMEHFGRRGIVVNGGWWILIFGLVIEVITAFALTVHAEHENQANDPLNQKISDIVGFVYLEVKGTNVDVPLDPAKTFKRGCAEAYLSTTNVIGGMLPPLSANTYMRGNSFYTDGNRSYYLRFQAIAASAMWLGGNNNTMKVRDVERHKILFLTCPFLTNNAEVVYGGAEVVVNGTVRYAYRVVAQPLARQFADSPDDSPRWMVATNVVETVGKQGP